MIILTYHKIKDVANFEKQIAYLVKNKYEVLSISDFLIRYTNRGFASRDILLTFDDGDHSLLENALPILKKYDCPAVVFVVTSLIGTDKPFWWEEIEYHTRDKNRVRQAKLLSNQGRIRLMEDIRSRSDLQPLTYRQLTVSELKVMEKNGMAIANHSHDHPMLDKLGAQEIDEDLRKSSDFLRENGFAFYDVFAYPNGNHNTESEKILSMHKVRVAFLFDHKLNKHVDNPYRISRLSVNDNTPLWKYRFILTGWHSRILPLIKMINNVFLYFKLSKILIIAQITSNL